MAGLSLKTPAARFSPARPHLKELSLFGVIPPSTATRLSCPKRYAFPPGERIYTFWQNFRNAFARDTGLRIDHLLLSPAIAGRLVAAEVDRDIRGREKASDHAPGWIKLPEVKGRSAAAPTRARRLSGRNGTTRATPLSSEIGFFGKLKFVAARCRSGEDDLIGRALHQHKLHFAEVNGLRRDQPGRIFLKNDRLVFHEGE
jgi:hypothetical protein